MSLFSTLQTAVSGLSAQSSKLGTIGDNIANSSTTGYKGADTEFETLLGEGSTSSYQSGGVQTKVRYGITDQGDISATTSVTDLAISGNGFFVVQPPAGGTALTRAGSFVPDASGNLINTAGFKLLGYNLTDGSYNAGSASGTLEPINVSTQSLIATPSSSATLGVNLPSTATAVAAADLPSANSATATYTAKTSLTAYDDLGTAVDLDVYMTKTGDNSWEVATYNAADAASGGGFPYGAAALNTQNLTFDPTTGNIASGSATSLSIPIPNGKTVTVDMSKTTQLASDYEVGTSTIDGNAPSKVSSVSISTNGTVSTVYASGVTRSTYKIPLANVESPDNMTVLSGNVYEPNLDSGPVNIGSASSGSLGKIDSSSLEGSTVDLATELTNMISTQNAYQANSKVLTTGSNMLTTLIQAVPT